MDKFELTKDQLEALASLIVAAAAFGLDSGAFSSQWNAADEDVHKAFEAIRQSFVGEAQQA